MALANMSNVDETVRWLSLGASACLIVPLSAWSLRARVRLLWCRYERRQR